MWVCDDYAQLLWGFRWGFYLLRGISCHIFHTFIFWIFFYHFTQKIVFTVFRFKLPIIRCIHLFPDDFVFIFIINSMTLGLGIEFRLVLCGVRRIVCDGDRGILDLHIDIFYCDITAHTFFTLVRVTLFGVLRLKDVNFLLIRFQSFLNLDDCFIIFKESFIIRL